MDVAGEASVYGSILKDHVKNVVRTALNGYRGLSLPCHCGSPMQPRLEGVAWKQRLGKL